MRILSLILLFLMSAHESNEPSTFTDKRDGTVYHTMNVNGSVWMVDNLKYKNGDGVYLFDNDPNNKALYGMLYDWKAAQNACPAGWRLPSGDDYRSVLNHFEQKGNWTKGQGDHASFNIQLGGMQDMEGTFLEMDESAYYWTSTEYDKSNAEYFSFLIIDDKPIVDISRKEDIADIHGTEKTNRYSVRCLRE